MTTPVKKRTAKAAKVDPVRMGEPARMSDPVKIAIIAAITIISVTAVWMYFSPYQSCIRGELRRNFMSLELRCADAIYGRH
jgi:hypothetical protein